MFRILGVTPFAILSIAAIASAQEAGSQPTARELFYQAATPAKSTAPAKTAARPKAPTPTPAATASNTTPAPAATPVSAPMAAPGTPPPPAPMHVQPRPQEAAVSDPGPSSAHLIRASSETGPALGLRYSIVRVMDDKRVEVPGDFIFHSGDQLQVNVQPNAAGYLYVVSKGASGVWTPIFPSPKIAKGDNHVDGFHTYTLPTPEYQISFDTVTGTENLTIVFSRQPVADFESLIYSLQGQTGGQAQPEEQLHSPMPKGKVMMASVQIDDDIVGRLRNVASRDLIVEPVDSSTPADTSSADKKETAVYVVSRTGSSDSRLTADLHLVHK